jgi:S-DNA-T family DNA segregation ATPase FtsK/SpoIIIE
MVVFPLRAIHMYLTWAHIASGCGLTHKRRRWRWSLEAMPIAGHAARSAEAVAEVAYRRRMRRTGVERAPRLGLPRPNLLGWRIRVELHDGQVPADYSRAAEQLAHAWRVHGVRVVGSSPGRVWLLATRKDPLVTVAVEPETGRAADGYAGAAGNGQAMADRLPGRAALAQRGALPSPASPT